MSRPRVTVVGGGVAGIVAALDCASAGANVTLVEVRRRLGGAAYSFRREGLTFDNGQHVFLRCCTAYRSLLDRLGSASRVFVQRRLEIPVLAPGRQTVVLRRNGLPAPLHLATALLRYPHLKPAQRVRAAMAAGALSRLDLDQALARERAAGATLGQWLAEHGQGRETLAALWDLVALPTLNVPAAEASLALGAFVLQTSLLDRADAGDIGFHTRPLSETIGEPALRALSEAGVEVRLGWRAQSVVATGGRLDVRGEGGRVEGEAAVVAVPHMRAAPMLAGLLGESTEGWQALGSSPIVNVHVVYDRPVCDVEFAAGVGTPVQYVFDRTAAAGLKDGQCLAVSISGANAEMEMGAAQLRRRYVEALAELFPKARRATVRMCLASREHAATFAATPGVQEHRPGPGTVLPGLALAGAWTDTGWPATLEGAARSGHAAARVALASIGIAGCAEGAAVEGIASP